MQRLDTYALATVRIWHSLIIMVTEIPTQNAKSAKYQGGMQHWQKCVVCLMLHKLYFE